MPSQHSRDTIPVHVRRPKVLVEAARERLAADGRTMTDLVDHALSEYIAGRLTLPPPTR